MGNRAPVEVFIHPRLHSVLENQWQQEVTAAVVDKSITLLMVMLDGNGDGGENDDDDIVTVWIMFFNTELQYIMTSVVLILCGNTDVKVYRDVIMFC